MRGHLSYLDCYEDNNFDGPDEDVNDEDSVPRWYCHCKEKAAWWNLVDTTNDEGDETKFVILLPAKTEVCNLGHRHTVQEAICQTPKGGHLTRWAIERIEKTHK